MPRDWSGGEVVVVAWEGGAVLCLPGQYLDLVGMVVC